MGAPPLDKFPAYSHRTPMLSLSNAFDDGEVEPSTGDPETPGAETVDYTAEPKFDGLAVSLITRTASSPRVHPGRFHRRGGDANVRTVPRSLCGSWVKAFQRARSPGEVILLREDFAKLNRAQRERGEKEFANPRTPPRLSPPARLAVTASRPLSSSPIPWTGGRPRPAPRPGGGDGLLSRLGFSVCPSAGSCPEPRPPGLLREILARRDSLPYDIDGVVYN